MRHRPSARTRPDGRYVVTFILEPEEAIVVMAGMERVLDQARAEVAAPSCTRTTNLHAHHVVYWSQGGRTELADLINPQSTPTGCAICARGRVGCGRRSAPLHGN